MEVKTFGVIGAGQMGNGIAQVAAASGLSVIMNDIKPEFVERGLATITKNLQRSVDKGKLSAEAKDQILARIKTSTDLKDMAAADFVVEAASENEVVKFQIFENLEEICAPHVNISFNRILLPMINEAVFCLYHGVGTKEDIDTVMKLGMNHPMGPLALADLIGLDTCLAIMETLHKGLGDSKYRPCPLLRQYVEAGYLGRKSGKGFYSYL